MQTQDPETPRGDERSPVPARAERTDDPAAETARPEPSRGASGEPPQELGSGEPAETGRPEPSDGVADSATDHRRSDHPMAIALAAGGLILLLAVVCALWWKPWSTPSSDHLGEAESRAAADALEIYLQPGDRGALYGRETPRAELHDAVLAFYKARDFAPAWIEPTTEPSDGSPSVVRLAPIEPRIQELLLVLDHAPDDGLRTEDYRLGHLGALLDRTRRPMVEIRSLLDLDVTATEELFAFGRDLATGRVEPSEIDPSWALTPPTVDLAAALGPAFTTEDRGSIRRRLEDLAPPHPQYRALREQLAALREQAARTGRTAEASRSRTLAGRIRTVELNMERWRWLPRDLGDPHVEVNVAGFRLRVVEGDHTVLTMPVVVGKRSWKTPFFHDRLEKIVLNPRWNVPESIAVKDVLPKVLNDSDYLSDHRFEVLPADARGGEAAEQAIDPGSVDWASVPTNPFPYRFRQGAGPGNALGRIKFLFPNSFSVYLHDTPADALFNRADRALSHGCIRLSRPFDLADYLLRDAPEWSRDHILRVVKSGQRTWIDVPNRPPVYILYWTAVVGDDGELQLHDDPYGVDTTLAAALDATSGGDRIDGTDRPREEPNRIAAR